MFDPSALKFLGETHEWVHLDGDVATVGVSRFAVDQLTDLTLLELPKVGAKVTSGKSFGVIESVKSANDVYSPVSGEVIAVNDAATTDFSLLSNDPYGKGWLIKVRIADSSRDLATGLLDDADYQKKIAESPH